MKLQLDPSITSAWECDAFESVQINPKRRNPVTGEICPANSRAARCQDHNANGNCESFERKPARAPSEATKLVALLPSQRPTNGWY